MNINSSIIGNQSLVQTECGSGFVNIVDVIVIADQVERRDTMLANIGVTGWLVIILIGLLLFGPKKLPELGRSIGRTLQEFKKGSREMIEVAEHESTEKSSDEPISEK